MRKRLIVFLSVLLFFMIPVYADGTEKNQIVFTDEYTAEDALSTAYNGEPEDGSGVITKSTIEEGIKFAEKMNNNGSKTETEEWVLTKTETLQSYGPIKGKYKRKLAVGESATINVSFTVSGSIGNIPLTESATFSTSATYSGPAGTETVGNYNATHRYMCAIGRGTITRYTYRIQDPYSGAYIRTETITRITNKKTDLYGVFAYLNSGTGYVTYRSVKSSSVRSFREDSFIAKLNSINAWYWINF